MICTNADHHLNTLSTVKKEKKRKKKRLCKSFINSVPFARGVARTFLESGSKSSKISATMVDRQRNFWVTERLKR